jgi:hypothetical protein
MNVELVFLFEHQLHFDAVERLGLGPWAGVAVGYGECDGRHEVRRGRRR